MRAVVFVLLLGCSGADQRPATLEYITITILRPSCGLAACHAAETATAGYAFDTVEGAGVALKRLVRPFEPTKSELIDVLRGEQSMPPDSPMLDADVDLIEQWIAEGADGAN